MSCNIGWVNDKGDWDDDDAPFALKLKNTYGYNITPIEDNGLDLSTLLKYDVIVFSDRANKNNLPLAFLDEQIPFINMDKDGLEEFDLGTDKDDKYARYYPTVFDWAGYNGYTRLFIRGGNVYIGRPADSATITIRENQKRLPFAFHYDTGDVMANKRVAQNLRVHFGIETKSEKYGKFYKERIYELFIEYLNMACEYKCAKDCADVCYMTIPENFPDCEGVCNGPKVLDCAGVCGGKSVLDCNGVCDGPHLRDCAGQCYNSKTETPPNSYDCAGYCGPQNFSYLDCNGNCINNKCFVSAHNRIFFSRPQFHSKTPYHALKKLF